MKKRVVVFLEFLIGGIILGVIEDFLLIRILTSEPITFSLFLIVLLVTLPFAFVGEFIVDRINFLELLNLDKKYRKIEVFLEFLIFGIILGVVEDLTAFSFAIGNPITINVFLVAFAIAIPFAFVNEFILDRIHLLDTFEEKQVIWRKD